MKKTKIDWCDSTWNPVTGCLHGCEYCYARRIAERFGLDYAPSLDDLGMEGAAKYDGPEGTDMMLRLEKPYRDRTGKVNPYPMAFMPTFHRYRLEEPSRWTKPRTIFVCSMADLFGEWVPDEWIQEVFDACRKGPQHRYLFLTKNPDRYVKLAEKGLLPKEENFWYGSTTETSDKRFFYATSYNTFASVEPILGRFKFNTSCNPACDVNWVIIGAETGKRKDKVIPEKEWIMDFVRLCIESKTPLFMKESLREIMGEDFIQEFPWDK